MAVPPVVPIRQRGKLDNYDYWNSVLSGDTFLKGLIFQELAIHPFVGNDWVNKSIPTLVYLGSLGRFLATSDNGGRPNGSTLMIATIGETLAPCLPTAYFVCTQKARAVLVDSVKALMKYDLIAAYTEGTRANFHEEIQLLTNNDPLSIFHGESGVDAMDMFQIPVPGGDTGKCDWNVGTGWGWRARRGRVFAALPGCCRNEDNEIALLGRGRNEKKA